MGMEEEELTGVTLCVYVLSVGPSTFFYSHSPNCRSVLPFVLVFHCYTYTYLTR